jgi:hypothetical protein
MWTWSIGIAAAAALAAAPAPHLQPEDSQPGKAGAQNIRPLGEMEDVEGTALGMEGDVLRLRTDDEGEMTLRLDASTVVTFDGRDGSASQIEAGASVRAIYLMVNGEALAVRLEISSKNKAHKPQKPRQRL